MPVENFTLCARQVQVQVQTQAYQFSQQECRSGGGVLYAQNVAFKQNPKLKASPSAVEFPFGFAAAGTAT